MIEYAVEPLTIALIGETIPVQDGYWQEVAEPFHPFPPDVNWPLYLKAQEMGNLKFIVGRSEGRLVAGTFVVSGPDPHYACLSGSLPLLFVHPDFRRGREGLRLVKLAEQEAQKSGAQLMRTHGGVHNGVHRLFEHLDYLNSGMQFFKVIGDTKPVYKGV